MRHWLLALMMFTAPALGQDNSLRFATSPDAPIELTGKTITVDQGENRALLDGAATMKQGELSLAADSMRVLFDVAPSGAAREIFAKGNVVLIDKLGQTSHADNAHFHLQKEQLVMQGNVQVENPHIDDPDSDNQFRNMTGQRLVVDMRTGISTMAAQPSDSGTPTPRVRIELKP